MTPPTDSQEERLSWTEGEFTEALEELDRMIGETLPRLNELLAAGGIPEVRVPPRGSGPEEFR